MFFLDNNTVNIAIVILAAGASTRMGSPKQLLKWGDTTLLDHSINTALNTAAKDVFVVLGAYFSDIQKHIKHKSIHILKNDGWELGLGSSISFAANYLQKNNFEIDGILFMLADQPLITNGFLNELIQNFKPNTNDIIVTSYGTQKGVPAIFDKTYFKLLSELDGNTGAKQVITDYETYVKWVKPPKKNVDLDTVEDYKILFKKTFEEEK